MATIRYRQRGVKKLWHYEIRDESGKSLAYQGGFKTKRMAQLSLRHLLRQTVHLPPAPPWSGVRLPHCRFRHRPRPRCPGKSENQ